MNMKIKMHNSISDFSDLSDLEREFNKDEKLEVRGIELEKTCLKMNIGVNENKGHEIKGLEDFVDDLQENVDKTMIEKREGKILDQNLEDIYKELMEILHAVAAIARKGSRVDSVFDLGYIYIYIYI